TRSESHSGAIGTRAGEAAEAENVAAARVETRTHPEADSTRTGRTHRARTMGPAYGKACGDAPAPHFAGRSRRRSATSRPSTTSRRRASEVRRAVGGPISACIRYAPAGTPNAANVPSGAVPV